MPTPSFVIIADVSGETLNSSAANFRTAVNGVASGTLNTLNGSFGSEVSIILKVTLDVISLERNIQTSTGNEDFFNPYVEKQIINISESGLEHVNL